MEHSSNSQNDIISPIPQRAYAFVTHFDGEEPLRPQCVPWCGAPGLLRPTSAPVGLGTDGLAASMGLLERPSSPLCRVTNPMVRDNLFRRGFVGGEKIRKGRLPNGVGSVNAGVSAE